MASRDYIVNYNIAVNTGNSFGELQKLIKPIQEMQTGLTQLTSAIKEFNAAINNLKIVSQNMSFRPQVDLGGFRDAMASMEVNAKETAMRIRNAMERTLVGSRKDFDKSTSLLGANNFKEASAGFDRDISSLKSKLQFIEDVKTKLNSKSVELKNAATERLDLWSKAHGGLDPFKTLSDEFRVRGLGNILNMDKGEWKIADTEKYREYLAETKKHLASLEELQKSHLEMAAKRSEMFDKTMAPLNANKGFSSILGISGDELKKQAEAFTDIHKIFSDMPEGGMKIDIGMKLTGLDTVKTELEAKVNQLQEIANKRSVIIKSLYEDLPQQKTTTVKPPMPAPPKGMTQDYMFRDDKRMINDKEIMSGQTGWSSEEIERLRQRYEKNVKLRNQYAQQLRAWRNDPGQIVTEPANIPMTFVPKIDMSKLEGEINSTFSKLISLVKEHSVSIPVKLNPSEKIHEELIKGIGQLQKIADKSYIKVGIKAEAVTDKTGKGTSAISGISKIQEEAGKALSVKVSIDNKGIESAVTNSISRLQKLADKSSVRIRAIISQNSSGFDLNQSLMRIQKIADQHPILLKAALSKNSAGFDLNQSLSKIQKLADQHPILLRAVLSKNSGGFDVQQSLSKIQKLADQRPILLRATLSKNNGGFDLQQSLARLQKLADKTPIRLNAKLTVSKSDINEQIKKFNPTINAKINLTWGGTAEKSAQLKKMESKLPALKVTLNLTEAEAALNKLAAKIKAMNPVAMATGGNANTNTMSQSGGGGRGSRSIASGPKVADSSKSRWYTLLGNTSYGANTPVAVDMFKGMGVMYGVSGAMGVMTDAFTQAVQYQNTMETAKSILKDNYMGNNFMGEYDIMAKQARDVAVKTKFTAAQTADAVRFMAMAGLDMSTIKSSIAPIADIAVIGDNDLGEVADKMTNIQTAFKIKPNEMRKVADMLAKTFTSTNTDMMMLANSMEYAAPMASMANWKKGATGSLAEALAMIGIMGNSGIQASMAGTTTRMMYQNILKTTKDQRKYWDALGIKLKDSDGSPRNMIDLLTELSNKLDIKSEAGKAVLPGMMANLFRVTAGPGAAAVVQNIDKVRALAEANKAAEGNSAEISMAKQNTIQGMWHQVTSTFTEGIVKAFEQNDFQQFIREKLGELKNYFASPEFVQSLQTVMDMLKDLVGVFGTFAKYWLWIYEKFGGIAKYLIVAQGFFTQIGYVIKPIAQLVNLAKSLIGPNTAAAIVPSAITSAATKGALVAAIGAGGHYYTNEVLRRAVSMKKISGWSAIGAGFMSAVNYDMATSVFKMKSVFLGGVLNVVKALGFLVNPITLTAGAITALGIAAIKAANEHKKAIDKLRNSEGKVSGSIDATNKLISNNGTAFKPLTAPSNIISELLRVQYNVRKTPERYKYAMLKNTAMFRNAVNIPVNKDNLLGESEYGVWSAQMWKNRISPLSEYLFDGKVKDMGEALRYYGYQPAEWGPLDRKRFSEAMTKMVNEATIAQATLQTHIYKNFQNQAISLWKNYQALPEKERTDSAAQAVRNKIKNMAERLRESAVSSPTINNSGYLGNYTALQLAQSSQGYLAMARGIENLASRENAMTAIMQLRGNVNNKIDVWTENMRHVLRQFPLMVEDIKGKIHTIKIPMGLGSTPNWAALKTILAGLGSQIKTDIGSQLGWMSQIYQQMMANEKTAALLKGMSAGQWFVKTNKIKHGETLTKEDYNLAKGITMMENPNMTSNQVDNYLNQKVKGKDGKYHTRWTLVGEVNKMREKAMDMLNPKFDNPTPNNNTNQVSDISTGNGNRSPYADLTDQSAYKSKYERQGTRPTQIVINIDKLANFDKTQFLTADKKVMANKMQEEIAQAVAMAFSQIAPSFNALASNEIG